MGVSNLNKNLKYFNCIETLDKNSYNILQYINNNNLDKVVFIDFSKILYKYAFNNNITSEEELQKNIYNYLNIFTKNNYEIHLFLDKGTIINKEKTSAERKINKNYIINKCINTLNKYIDYMSESNISDFNKFTDNNIEQVTSSKPQSSIIKSDININLFKLNFIKNIKTISDNFLIYLNKIENINIYYEENVDAEYVLVNELIKYYNKNRTLPYIISDDQDVVLLIIVNIPCETFIINDLKYNINLFAFNLTILTFIYNKSDYFDGIFKCRLNCNSNNMNDNIIKSLNRDYTSVLSLFLKTINLLKPTKLKDNIEIDVNNKSKLLKRYIGNLLKYLIINKKNPYLFYQKKINPIILDTSYLELSKYCYLFFSNNNNKIT